MFTVNRDKGEIEKELLALSRLMNYPEWSVFLNLLDRWKQQSIEELLQEGITETKEDYIRGKESLCKKIIDLKDDLKNCSNDDIRGKVSIIKNIKEYFSRVAEALLILRKPKEGVKEIIDTYNDSNLGS